MSFCATSRSALYQYGLMLSASTSIPCFVHRAEAIRGLRHHQHVRQIRLAGDLQIHERHGLGHRAVRVDVDRLHPLAIDHDLTAPRLRLRASHFPLQPACDEGDTADCARQQYLR